MGYDVELIQVQVSAGTAFPIDAVTAAKLVKRKVPFDDASAVRDRIGRCPGCKPGPEGCVDFLGHGLSYGRFFVHDDHVHVDNNCSPRDLLAIFKLLRADYPTLVIHDLQNGSLHDDKSFADWWARPL